MVSTIPGAGNPNSVGGGPKLNSPLDIAPAPFACARSVEDCTVNPAALPPTKTFANTAAFVVGVMPGGITPPLITGTGDTDVTSTALLLAIVASASTLTTVA